MACVRYLEDFRVGETHSLGSWTITADEVVDFARRFDPQPVHLDAEIASGWHLSVLFMRMYVDRFLIESAAEVSPGVEELSWLAPVRPGETLAGDLRIGEVSGSLSRPECGIVRQHGQLSNSEGSVVMRIVFYGLIRRRVWSSA